MDEKNKQKSKSLISGTIIYAVGNLSTKILSFIIVPLYTYYINTTDMGDYDLINTTVSLLVPLVTLQISDAAYAWILRGYAKAEECITAIYKYIICSSILISSIILIINHFISIKFCVYMILQLIFNIVFGALQKLLRSVGNQKLFAISGVVYTAVFLLLNLLQIVVLKQGVEALFQSAIISHFICSLLILFCEKRIRTFSFKSSLKLQKEMLKFSVPLVPNQLNWWIMNASDRYIIKFFLNSSANGIYAVAYKFPSTLQLIFNMFYLSWQDMAMVDKDKNPGEFYTKVFKLYYKFAFSFLVVLVPITKLFIYFTMENSYHDASKYVGILYLGTIFQAFSSFFGVGYLKNDKTNKAATSSIFGAIINAVINLVLINYIGLYAAAISTFISFLVMFIIRVFHTKRTMQIKINNIEFTALFFVAVASVIICLFSNNTQDIIIAFVGLMFFFIVNKETIINAIKKFKNKALGKLKK